MIASDSSRNQKIIDVFSVSKFAPKSDCPKGDVDCVSRIRKEEELLNCKFVRAEVDFLSFADSELRGHSPDFDESATLDFEKLMAEKIKNEIRPYFADSERIFFPLAIGRHVDHVIISKIGLELTVDENALRKTYFYEDLPYSA